MGEGDKGIRSKSKKTNAPDLGERDELRGGVCARCDGGHLSDLPRCVHGMLPRMCSLCLGYPQSNHVGSGPPGWVKG